MAPRYVVVKVPHIFKLTAAAWHGAVLCELGHIIDQRVEQVSQRGDFNELFFGRHLLLKLKIIIELTMIPSRSSPKLFVKSSSRSTSESDQYLPAFGTFCRLWRALAATLAISMSSRFESFNTSTNFSKMFASPTPSSLVAVLSP